MRRDYLGGYTGWVLGAKLPYFAAVVLGVVSTAAGLYLVRCIVRPPHPIRSVIGEVWMLGTFGGGWMLAWLYKRLHPHLSFYKLWAFWSPS